MCDDFLPEFMDERKHGGSAYYSTTKKSCAFDKNGTKEQGIQLSSNATTSKSCVRARVYHIETTSTIRATTEGRIRVVAGHFEIVCFDEIATADLIHWIDFR